ncbi:U3 small nucleolar RNA-associated protein 21 homolog isoform X2 [Miscanthus floridulus]|uniref:U3 small nucleolar RNA-associated protein 21 homolog isoform X2 n=1 Tax=Miscanthus floridulus TaxID=154761 RepID=UPI00345A4949
MGIFEPFRAIGYITAGGVPFSVQRLGTETFVTVSVGKAFHVYNCAKLNLVLAGPQLPKKIRAIACYKDYTFAAYGSDIAVFKRTDQVATWSRHEEKVNMLYLFGEYVLSADAKGNIFMWAFRGAEPNSEPVGSISLGDKFTPSCIMHPDTFLNKVIVGSEEGPLQLWNISTKKKLYDFNGWNSLVRCCVSSPALDVVAVGCSDGSVHVHNVRYDEELMSFNHQIRGAVTALSFRTDGQPLLASGGSSGVISIWNLEKRRLHSVIREAHDGSIVSLHFFANEPILMSSAADNSIKIWIFDSNDGDARLLRFRSGHSAPPRCIRFYGNGKCILSAGQDRAFRLFSVIQDQQSRELSQRHVAKRAKRLRVKEEEIKLKPVVTFDCAEIRARDWCNVVTCHMDTPQAYVWRLQNFVIGEHVLTPSSSTVTPIKLWDFKTCKLKSRLDVGKSVTKIAFHRPNGLLATVAGDMVLILFDTVSMKMVRRFEGHTDRITDLCFSEDGKWLISSSMDGTLRIWDISLARQIDAMHVDVSITSISMSPNMDVLATTHVDQNGVYLWVNQSLFSASTNTENYGSGKHVRNVCLPAVSSAERSEEEQVQNSGESYKSSIKPFVVMDHQIPNLVTLSLLPKSQWQSLTNLDIIKVRNKPIEPPKKPEKAPFFLPSVPSLSGEILFEPPASTKETDISTTKNTYHKMSELSSHFSQLLQSCGETKDYSAFTDYLKGLSPSSLDMELRMLQIIDDEESEDLEQRPELQSISSLLDYFIHELSFRNNFEFVQAVLKLFLKIHGETIRRHSMLQSKVKKLLEVQSLVWQKIDKIFQGARCMVTFLSNSQF